MGTQDTELHGSVEEGKVLGPELLSGKERLWLPNRENGIYLWVETCLNPQFGQVKLLTKEPPSERQDRLKPH